MKRPIFLFLIILSFSLYARGPKVGRITCNFENLRLFASFCLDEGFLSPDVLEAINSTKATAFTYEVEVAKKRAGWFDKTIHRKVIEKTVTYDNLTHQYDVVTKIDDEEKEKTSLTSIDEVKENLGKIENMDIGSVVDLQPGEKTYYVRIRVTLLKGFVFWIIPSDVDTGWTEKDLKTP
jgi:hypothetical protein